MTTKQLVLELSIESTSPILVGATVQNIQRIYRLLQLTITVTQVYFNILNKSKQKCIFKPVYYPENRTEQNKNF